MVGRDISLQNKELITYVNKLKVRNKVYFLNEQKNLLEFYNGIDFLLLTSHSESFPNVIAESMLCSTPVLSSNAGCSKKIINRYGFVMNNNDHRSIYKNLNRTINFYKYKVKNIFSSGFWNEQLSFYMVMYILVVMENCHNNKRMK